MLFFSLSRSINERGIPEVTQDGYRRQGILYSYGGIMMLDELIVYHNRSLPNLPLTSFIGREQEVATVKNLLRSTRLLTLTGIGGCGKTRLALQVVSGLLERFEHGVWWVEVANLTDPVCLPQLIATVMGVCEPTHYVLTEQLIDILRSRELLLILDNCEHLIALCSQFVEALLRACPRLCILVTSREILDIAGETIWSVPPLLLPNPSHLLSLDDLVQYEAIRLFIERANAVQPGFRLTQENASAVVQICRRLDGIPLAIEMAAARLRVLSVEQIVARLNDCFQLLTSGYRVLLPRHHSLRMAMDWSYNLLSEREQKLFLRLSPFVRSFTLEEAEEVGEGDGIAGQEILDLLAGLINKSLLVAEENCKKTHYRLPEILRQYAQTRLYENQRVGKSIMPCRDLALAEQARLQQLRLFGLGSVQIYRDKQALTSTDWRYAKARELLFYLLCNRVRTKEQIGLALWPDTSSGQLRGSFHSVLHHLRRVLGGAEWVIFKDDAYSFNRSQDYWFDVESFESHLAQARKLQAQAPVRAIYHLEEGIKLYQGDFLEGAAMGDWYLPRQRELKKLYLNALLTLGQLLFTEGQYMRAADAYYKLIEHDSLQEIAHRELMRCYARQGERSQALRHYQVLTELLRTELKAVPAPETIKLFECLRNGETI